MGNKFKDIDIKTVHTFLLMILQNFDPTKIKIDEK